MKRDWRPGDVAVATAMGREFMVVRTADYWTAPGGWPSDISPDQCHYRRIVVIDPDDGPVLDRLAARIRLEGGGTPYSNLTAKSAARDVAALQAALRSLLEPPKPPEPTGLGAVVEDAKGDRWVRYKAAGVKPWRINLPGVGATEDYCHYYADIDVVRVLSEGV